MPRPTRGPTPAPTRTGLSPALARRSRRFRFVGSGPLAWSAFARRYLRSLALMSFPPASEIFQFAGFAPPAYGFSRRYHPRVVGCPIRRSRDQRALAPPPSFSQRATSFIASRCQGIHPMPFRCLIPLWAPRAGANPRADAEGCIVCDRTPGVSRTDRTTTPHGGRRRVRVDDADLPVNLGQSQNLLHMSKIEPGSGPRAGRARRLRGRDLNPRPSGYEPDELPGCSTPRRSFSGPGPDRRP